MGPRFQRLIGDPAGLPNVPPGFLDDLHYLRERRGEKIAAVEEASGKLLGAIGLHPDRDDRGLFYRLSAIDVVSGHREEGLEAALLGEVERYLRANKAHRLKWGTSPLFTASAELYITRMGSRYRWREGVKSADGQPWPHVICECDLDDPLARPLDLRDDEVLARSVLDWSGVRPSRRPRVVYSGPLAVLLPDLSREEVARASAAGPSFLRTLSEVFQELFRHGYGFAWFDRLPSSVASPGGARCYYVMNHALGF